jgi:hypothetical protein
MNVYIYRAALHCEGCGDKIKDALGHKFEGLSEYEFDSDEYPKGPFPNGGGEKDYPDYCDTCGLFLENPLTGDGEDYVKDTLCLGEGCPDVLEEWAGFYSYLAE